MADINDQHERILATVRSIIAAAEDDIDRLAIARAALEEIANHGTCLPHTQAIALRALKRIEREYMQNARSDGVPL